MSVVRQLPPSESRNKLVKTELRNGMCGNEVCILILLPLCLLERGIFLCTNDEGADDDIKEDEKDGGYL